MVLLDKKLQTQTLVGGVTAFMLLVFVPHATAREPIPVSKDRSPVDLAIVADGTLLVTANQASSSVSLVDIVSGSVLDEITVGRRPEYISCTPDGKSILVSCSAGGVVDVLTIEDGKLRVDVSIPVGFHPHGLAITKDSRTAYVALTAANQVGVIDLAERKLEATITVGRWPRYLALGADDARLAVGTSGDRGITIIDTQRREALFIERFLGLNIGHLQGTSDGQYVYFPWVMYRQNPITPENIRLGWVLATRVARMRVDQQSRREALSLDPPGKAVADPFGLALTRDDSWLIVSASGTHELLVMRTSDLPLEEYGGTDHLPDALRRDRERFDRIELGGRPMGLRIAADDRTAFIANYLRNSVQVVDIVDRKILRELPLGGPDTPSLARKGEAIFYDGQRSLDQWYSCHTCHYNGGINAERMDTMNDGTRFTFKMVLPLYDVRHTGPWTWHGWQQDLHDAMQASMTTTMQGPQPSAEDVDALLAFLDTLEPLPNPFRNSDGTLTEAAERGRQVFEGPAGCASCHSGKHFSDGQLHDVGLGSSSDKYPTFNTPTLQGVYERVKLLHDGRAKSSEEVLTGPHDPAVISGQPLSDEERRDLIEYLKSL